MLRQLFCLIFFFKQKTAYEMRISDWSSDVCSSDLIGAHVKAGQLLAEIETPDVDQQLAQARADLAKAKADADLAKSTATRWQAMLGSDAVSKKEVDEKTGESAATPATENAARATAARTRPPHGIQTRAEERT